MITPADGGTTGSAVTHFLADIKTTLAYHVPNEESLCAGCYLQFGLLHWYPCEQAIWAMSADGNRDLYRSPQLDSID